VPKTKAKSAFCGLDFKKNVIGYFLNFFLIHNGIIGVYMYTITNKKGLFKSWLII